MDKVQSTCLWEETIVAWETGCGELFCFTADGPKENNFASYLGDPCMYCNTPIVRKVTITDEE